jgi:hypothetical protein
MVDMKAIRIHAYGGPEVLRYEDAARPTAGAGKLLVRIVAAGVNPVDWKVRAGFLKEMVPLAMPSSARRCRSPLRGALTSCWRPGACSAKSF